MIVTILAFVVVLGLLISVHEFGHFIVARRVGVKVLTFSIGFGPKLFKRTIGETEYALSAFPLGGYVRLLGDDPKELVDPAEAHRSFLNQSVPKKMAIVFAGPFFNFILAYLVFVGILASGSPLYVPSFEAMLPKIDQVLEGSAAESAGMKPGDLVKSVDGRAVGTWDEMASIIRSNPGRELELVVERDGEPVHLRITPRTEKVVTLSGEAVEVGQIGVSRDVRNAVVESENAAMAVVQGLDVTWRWTELTVVGIAKLITGQISAKNIGGPILIAQMSGRAASEGLMNIALFVAILSINLGVINLLPIPILDGGHLVFFAIEGVMGKPISLRKREIAQQIGLFLLIFLMLFAFYNDIARMFSG